MSVEQNKASVNRAIERWNAGDLEGYLELYDPNFTFHGFPPFIPMGREGARVFYSSVWEAFPKNRLVIDDMIAEGDRVVVRYKFSGTHQVVMNGIPPTGRDVTTSGITVLRFANGSLVDRWTEADNLGMFQQMGVIPAMA